MGEVSLPILLNFVFFLLFPFIGGYLAKKIKLPAITGYIIGGLFLGVFLGGRMRSDFLSHFASFGIILLLFTVGLEAKLSYIRRFGRLVFFGGFLQILFSSILIFLLSQFFNFTFLESIIIGFSFSLASTAVVAKIIQDRGEESSFIGALIISILIFQDLAAVPLIILASIIGVKTDIFLVFKDVFFALLKSGLIMIVIFQAGRNIVPYIFNKIARKSRELLNLFSIFFIFAAVYLFSILGLSTPVAAFIAGVLVGQTTQHIHIFSQIRPFRDLFAILFFAFLGASVDVGFLLSNLPQIILFSLLLIALKILVILIVFTLFRFHTRSTFSISMYLSHVGEFAFIILYQALLTGSISTETYLFVTPSVLLSLALTPILITNKDKIYVKLRQFIKKFMPFAENYMTYKLDRDHSPIDVLRLKNHVVICGFGTVGKYIGRALTMSDVPFIGIDYNFHTVEKARKAGMNVIYGDPTDIDILDFAQGEEAAAVVLAVPGKYAQETIILNAKKLNRRVKVISRVTAEADQQRMKDLGAEFVVQPEFEAALSIVKKILTSFNLNKADIQSKIRRLKIEHGMV